MSNIFILLILILAACGTAPIDECDDSESLHQLADFPVGVAIDMSLLHSEKIYADLAIEQFNSITPENAFKAINIHPKQSIFNWQTTDLLADFCNTYSKRLHGHTLIWHDQLPNWINDFQGSRDDWEQLFREHIQSICTRYRGVAASWDVVNEAFNNNGMLRNSVWRKKIGDSYIEKAFRYAHEADPDALLFYNDYDLAMNETKLKAVLGLLGNLRLRGVPIDGIGMQMHISIQHPENTQIARAMKDIYEAGFRIHLSEIDVSINPLGKIINPTAELLERQANKLAAVTHLYNEIPHRYQYGMTFWGISDKNTWIRYHFGRDDYPLLFDDNYEPKPMYCKFKEAL